MDNMRMAAVAATVAIGLMGAGVTSPAVAASYIWTGTGSVTSLNAISNGVGAAAPTGSIKVGDALSFTISFSTEKAVLTSYYDANPTINLYYLTDLVFNGSIGSFSFQNAGPQSNDFQIWNNYLGNEDAQIASLSYPTYNYLPFDMGAGASLQRAGVFAVDYSGSVRSNDSISQIIPVSSFNSLFMALTFYNPDTKYIVQVFGSYQGQITQASASVPEPATWVMMVGGFGLVGSAMRRRNRPTALA